MIFLHILSSSALLLGATEAVSGQTPLSELSKCGNISGEQQRLHCYEAAARDLLQAEREGRISITDIETAQEQARAGFGLPSFLRRSPDRDMGVSEPDRITSPLASVRTSVEGRTVFMLEDGSVWAQTDTPPLRSRLEPGTPVTVRKATFGSFFLNAGTGRDYRVRRLD